MTTSDTIIRPATPADAETLATMQVAGWRWAYRGLMPDRLLDALDVRERQHMWERAIASADARAGTLIAEREGVPIGFASFAPARDDASAGEIYAIYLAAEEHASTGAGRALLTASLSALARGGFDAVTLWVLDTNERARRFYERAGFVADGATKLEELRGVPLPHVRYRRAPDVSSESS